MVVILLSNATRSPTNKIDNRAFVLDLQLFNYIDFLKIIMI